MSTKSKTSENAIWSYFKTSPTSVDSITCKLCLGLVKKCANTKNVRNHMKQNHSEVKISEFADHSTFRTSTHSVASTSSSGPNIVHNLWSFTALEKSPSVRFSIYRPFSVTLYFVMKLYICRYLLLFVKTQFLVLYQFGTYICMSVNVSSELS